jgi:predicted Zn-dependent protease
MKKYPHPLLKKGMLRLSLIALWLIILSTLQAVEKPLKDLEREASAVLSEPDNVARRKKIASVFQLADRYVATGQTNEALNFYNKALEHQPWNLDAQLAMARLLNATGDTNGAKQKAELVWNYAETDALLNQAATLLNKPFDTKLPNQEAQPTEPYSLILIPYDGTDIWITLSLREKLSEILGIPVTIRQVELKLPKPARDPIQLRAEDLRDRIVKSQKDTEFRALMLHLKLSTNSLTNNEAVFTFAEKVLDANTNKEPVRQFREELAVLRRLGPQWEASKLVEQLSMAVKARAGSGIGYLGVIPLDLFDNQSRYVFGIAGINQNCGIFSYRRYASALLDASPNRQRLLERALKQALSSTGLMFGLPRCTDPTCARAYVNSLEEHDAKQLKLCSQCQEGFSKRFGKNN